MLLIWRWLCFYPARPENTEENQPITNLKPRTFGNTNVTGKKVKDSSEDYSFLKFIRCKRNYLTTTKLSVFLSAADCANHAKFVFFMANMSCQRVSNCNKRFKTTQPPATVGWRASGGGKSAERAATALKAEPQDYRHIAYLTLLIADMWHQKAYKTIAR